MKVFFFCDTWKRSEAMRKNVEDEELQKIVRILTKSVSLKLKEALQNPHL